MTRADSALCMAAGTLLLVLAATWTEVSTIRMPLMETAVAVFAGALVVVGVVGLIAHRVRTIGRAAAAAAAGPVRARRGTPVHRPVRHMP